MSNSRIKAAFQDGKAFIPFVTCGDPSLETTKKIVAELAQAGAAVIELGIPFSDPTAEGPVIQSANMCALGAPPPTRCLIWLPICAKPSIRLLCS